MKFTRKKVLEIVVVAGILVCLGIALSFSGWYLGRGDCEYVAVQPIADDAELHRLCKMYRWSDPEWWEKNCKI